MKQTNIEVVKSLYEAFGNRNIPGILELLDVNVEWGEPENPFNPAAGKRFGHQGFLDWINIGRSAEEILILRPERFLSDHDTVAATGYMKCKAISTQKIYESDFVHLVVLENGKIKRFQEFFDTYLAGEAFK